MAEAGNGSGNKADRSGLEVFSDVVDERGKVTRRTAIGFLIAGPTLIAGARLVAPDEAGAAVPTSQPVDAYDFSDQLRDAYRPTANSIQVVVNDDGTVSFELHRSENGQGITTTFAMVIAEEMDLPLDRVRMSLRDAAPELATNQVTGGSNSVFSLYEPVRMAAGIAKEQMMQTAARQFGVDASDLTANDGVISAGGQSATYGELSKTAAVSKTREVDVKLKASQDFRIIGTPQRRIDALDIVTGKKVFAMDLKVPGALPTMIARAPTHNGVAEELLNQREILAMPGVTDVGIIKPSLQYPGGVVVRAPTFGQCIDAIRKMQVRWGSGPVDGQSDASVIDAVKQALPVVPPSPPGTVQEETFVFHFRPGDPLETNSAVADIRGDSGTIWAASKVPIWGLQESARLVGLPEGAMKFHVMEGGGSFGRKLFMDHVFEAALASKMFGKPVRLMWHRADMPRQGRSKSPEVSRVRLVHNDTDVLSSHQSHASTIYDLSHGLGESLTAEGFEANPEGTAQDVFALTAVTPYNFGPATHTLKEIFKISDFNTSSVRNLYSPSVRTAQELVVDKVAAAMGKDPFDFRQEFARDERMKAVLAELRKRSAWGKNLPAGVAQGVALAREYKSHIACVAEIDARPKTVNRKVAKGVAGPRVRRITIVVDPGQVLNPLGMEAQMIGGSMDGIAQCLTYGLHLQNGRFLEGSWDHSHYTRMQNSPFEVDVHFLEAGTEPGGAGELAVAPSMAATACALARATGQTPTEFPINFATLGYKPFPAVPPIPQSPRNGIVRARRERRQGRGGKRRRVRSRERRQARRSR